MMGNIDKKRGGTTVSGFFKNEFAVGLKVIPITKSEEIKRKLVERNISELRTLKAGAKTLSEWNKILVCVFAVLLVVSTLLIGTITNIQQNDYVIKSSAIDNVQNMKIAEIEQIKEVDDSTKQNLKQMIVESAEKSKSKLRGKYDKSVKITMIPILSLALVSIYFIFASRRSYYLNSIIQEAIEEKKELMDKSYRVMQ